MVAGASSTTERKKYSMFSDTYRTETMALNVRKGEAKNYNFKQLKDITGSRFRLGITRGYYYGETFSELTKAPEFKKRLTIVARDSLLYKMLLNNHLDGFIGDTVNVSTSLSKLGLLNSIETHPLPVYSSNIHVMFSKKNVSPEVVRTFNKSLSRIKSTGIYKKILNKYLQ